ncbi:MAG: hypothetical protein M3M85_00990 [bacterium]|nr:hypothetical protein [bacterium]
MKGVRTKKMYDEYQRYKKTHFKDGTCRLCDKTKSDTLEDFRYWRIVENLFPWDRIIKVHHMIISKRHATADKLAPKERQELEKLKSGYINKNYGVMAEATHRKKSIPGHFHLHLLVLK